MQYAGFWRRFGAFWLDLAFLSPLIATGLWLQSQTRFAQIYMYLPWLLVGLWFYVHLVKQYGGTPGKLLLKIKITKTDGTAVGYREALLRYSVTCVLYAISSAGLVMATLQLSDAAYFQLSFKERGVHLAELAPSWYGGVVIVEQVWVWSEFIIMLTNKERRALHDFLAGTVVVRS